MLRSLKKSVFLVASTAAFLVASAAAGTAFGETVTCKEVGTTISYKLDFNWKNDTVDISARWGTNSYKKLFKGGTAVRNNAQDKTFLAEGIAKQYVGGKSDCTLIETLYFDVTGKNGSSGILQKTGDFIANSSCKAKTSAPDLSPNSVEITCTR